MQQQHAKQHLQHEVSRGEGATTFVKSRTRTRHETRRSRVRSIGHHKVAAQLKKRNAIFSTAMMDNNPNAKTVVVNRIQSNALNERMLKYYAGMYDLGERKASSSIGNTCKSKNSSISSCQIRNQRYCCEQEYCSVTPTSARVTTSSHGANHTWKKGIRHRRESTWR